MRDYLLFQLYGPLASWGDIAVGEYRPSFAYPSKSAVIGLLAAALGIRRNEEERLKSLADACSFAVRADALGRLLRDYHTIQVPSAKKGVIHYTRRSELAEENLNTILSSRDYRCDAAYTVAIHVAEGSPYTVKELAEALKKPVFALYLGRKSCPPALPLRPCIVTTGTLKEAFDAVPFCDDLSEIKAPGPVWIHWDKDSEIGISPHQAITRRDMPGSRKRWQFDERREYSGVIGKEDAP